MRPTSQAPDAALPASILSVDYGVAALNRELRYVYANDAALAMVSMTREEILGRTPRELFPAQVSETERKLWEQLARESKFNPRS